VTYTVTVAALHLSDSFHLPADASAEVPYSDRPKAVLEVGEDETLKTVLERAATELNVSVSGLPGSPVDNMGFIAFYEEGDESEVRTTRDSPSGKLVDSRLDGLWDLTTVDASGAARWSRHFSVVRYDELVRASETGFIRGDVFRPYLIASTGESEGLLLTWEGLMAAFLTLRTLLREGLGEEFGGIDVALLGPDPMGLRPRPHGGAYRDRLMNRRRRAELAAQAIEQHQEGWATRGARPDNFREMIERAAPWSSDDLAERLGTSVGTAEAILGGFGFSQEASGLWTFREDDDAVFMNDALEEAMLWVNETGAPDRQFAWRMETYVWTGKRREPFWS